MQLISKQLIKRSRMRFWVYTTWPFLVWIAASWVLRKLHTLDRNQPTPWILVGLIVLYLCYFLFPANLLIYGVNDIADGDTDIHNPKKWTYEAAATKTGHWSLLQAILWYTLLPHIIWVAFLIWLHSAWYPLQRELLAVRGAFYLTSIFYSLPPIRAKAHPFIDWIFNVLYCIPWLISYLMLWGTRDSILWLVFLAWRIRSIAMHTYSAIPDIKPDKKAGLTTTAVLLWKQWTHWYCGILWTIAAALLAITIPALTIFAILACLVYLLLLIISYRTDPFRVYTWFPYVNWVVGFILFWLIMFL